MTLDGNIVRPHVDLTKRKIRWRWVIGAVIAVLLAVVVAWFCVWQGVQPGPVESRTATIPGAQGGDQPQVATKVTWAEATKMTQDATTVLRNDVAAQTDSVIKRDTLLHTFCLYWAGWAHIDYSDNPQSRDASGQQIVHDPFMPFHDAAAQLYAQVASQAEQDYGMSKHLPAFDPAYQAQCLVY